MSSSQEKWQEMETEERTPAMELRIMINYLYRLSDMPKVAEPIRRKALSLVDKMEGEE